MDRRTIALALAALLALAYPGHGQGLGPIREELSRSLADNHFAAAFAGLVLLSDELELSTARFDVDNDFDTEFMTLALPFHHTLHPWGEEAPGLYVEGVLGYARAKEGTDDVYSGALPGSETKVDAKWTTYGGLVGLGPEFAPCPELTVAAILNVGLARIESDADYSGPGAAFTAALLDGIAFNWDGLVLSGGGATRLDWTRPIGASRQLELIGRYDLRWAKTVDTDDAAQRFSNRIQLVTLRGDVTGATGLHPFGLPLGWRTIAGYRYFAEGSLFDARHLVELGGSLELGMGEQMKLVQRLSLNVGVFLGEDLRGLSLGISASP